MMIWNTGKTSARRKEIRRVKAGRRVPWHRRLPGQFTAWAIGLTIVVGVLCALIINLGGDALPLREGQRIPRAITARVDFRIYDEQQTNEMRQRERAAAPNYYRLDVSLLEELRGRLSSLPPLVRTRKDDPAALKAEAAANKLLLDEAAMQKLLALAAENRLAEFEGLIDIALRRLSGLPLIEPDTPAVRKTATMAILTDPRTRSEREVARGKLVYANESEAVSVAAAEMARAFPAELRPAITESVAAMLKSESREGVKPLYLYDSGRSTQAAQEAAEAVPPQYLNYKENDILATAGVLTADEMELLAREHENYQKALTTARLGIALWLPTVGRGVLALLVVAGVAAYMSRYQRVIALNPLRGLVAVVVLLGLLLMARLVHVSTELPLEAVVGIQAFAAGLLALVYSHGSVFAIASALAVLITLATGRGIEFCLVLLSVSATMLFLLRDVRSRGKIVAVGLISASVAFVVTFSAGLWAAQPLGFILRAALWAGGTTLLAAFIIEGVLPGIERLFRLSTSMTLLELCDPNRPLLRMMAAEAPGTYNHSMLVGTLAESAVEAIGGHGLLARAGAFYHDIGKINKPEYFVENQLAGVSRHERLSPAMSLLIIIGHVKDGIEMAKEYGLPRTLIPFIAEHHGTTLVEYFYHAANKQRKPGDPEVADTEFRYPGPKPQSRETAVLMLCDAVEGAVRAMSEPTPNRIETVVTEIARRRLMDGQLDECDLTFRELEVVERSLIKTLCGIYHARIAYPERDDERKPERAASTA